MFQLKDISKAIRVAIQFAIDETAEQKKIYTEKICSTCGAKSKKELKVEIYPVHKAFLEGASKTYGLQSVDVSNFRARLLSNSNVSNSSPDPTVPCTESAALPA